MLKRLFNWILFLMLILVVSWSYHSYIAAQTQVKTFEASIVLLQEINAESNIISGLNVVFNDLFNLATLQILTFLLSTTALIFLLWFIYKLYMVAEKNSFIDPLTEIYNRRATMLGFKSELERAKRFNHPLSVAIADIDYFKKYNDLNGHLAGDKALIRVSKILEKNIRVTDIIGRIGGEEFLIIFPETKKSEAFKICERMREHIEYADFLNEKSLPNRKLTISMGIEEFNPEIQDQSKENLIHKADKRLYLAKLAGRNRVK